MIFKMTSLIVTFFGDFYYKNQGSLESNTTNNVLKTPLSGR